MNASPSISPFVTAARRVSPPYRPAIPVEKAAATFFSQTNSQPAPSSLAVERFSLPGALAEDVVADFQEGEKERQNQIAQTQQRIHEWATLRKFLETEAESCRREEESFKSHLSALLDTQGKMQKFLKLFPSQKQNGVENSPAPIPQEILEGRLLAKIYNPTTSSQYSGDLHAVHEYKGSIYWREEVVLLLEFFEASREFFIMWDRYTAIHQTLFYDEMVFRPLPGNIYLVRTSAGKYFPAVVKEILLEVLAPHPEKNEPRRVIHCRIQCVGSELLYEKTFFTLKDLLPFGPDHPKALLLERDERDGSFLLKEKTRPS